MTSSRAGIRIAKVGLILCYAGGWARAQDVSLYEIVRFEYFTQATTNRPSRDAATTHDLGAYIAPTYAGSVQSATLSSPKGWSEAMTDVEGNFSLPAVAAETTLLPQPAQAGAYRFDVIGANQGQLRETLSVPGPANGLAPVRIANFEAAQRVSATNDFLLEWGKVTDPASHDFLYLHVLDSGGDKVFDSGQLLIEQTSLTIPAGTLEPNKSYYGYLHLNHYFKFSKGPSPPHWVIAESRITKFTIKTLNPAGVFRFSPACITATETDEVALMTVERRDGSEGDVTVDYYSTDGTALAKTNYAPVSGTLHFLPGETQHTFPVPLLEDPGTNPPLTIHFTLTNATGGAGLATRPHANLTILDSQTPPGTNIAGCVLARVEFYSQTNAATPTQKDRSVRSRFYAAVHTPFPGGVGAASVQLPDGSSRNLRLNFENYHYSDDFSEDFPSRTSLNKTYKGGKYTLNFSTLSDGTFSVVMNFGAERSFSVPQLTNWVEAQTIDAGAPFELKWAPFVGATTNDYVRVVVFDDTSEYLIYTPSEFETGALPGTTSSFTIPANTLDFGRRYVLNVIFSKMSSAGKAGSQLRTGIASVHTTIMYIHTAPGP